MYFEKKVLARNTAKPATEGRGKAAQRRGQRVGAQEGQDGEGRGWGVGGGGCGAGGREQRSFRLSSDPASPQQKGSF